MNRKMLIACALPLLILGAVEAKADTSISAKDFPQREVRIVVPWAAGGFTDKLARMLGEKLGARLGHPVIIDNKAGASGLIGSEYVMRSAPDGLTLLLQTTDGTVKMMSTDRVDPVRDFTNIATLATQPVTLSVGAQVPVNSVEEFVQLAKSKPEGISYASNGEGGATNLGMEIFAKQAGIKLLHVPYKGGSAAVQDLLANNVQAILLSVQALKPYFDAGSVKGLAISSPKRMQSVPNIRTFAEVGYPNFQVQLWYALSGPRGIPEPIVNRLNKEVKEILELPDFRQVLTQAAADPLISTAADTKNFVAKEVARWKPVVKVNP